VKVVLDTNVILSAILFGGKPRQVLEAATSGQVTICISEKLISELEGVLHREKFGLDSRIVSSIVAELTSAAEVVQPTAHVSVIKDDPSDNDVIDCALQAKADCIVSGDRHLLELLRYGNVLILNPDDFLKHLEEQKES